MDKFTLISIAVASSLSLGTSAAVELVEPEGYTLEEIVMIDGGFCPSETNTTALIVSPEAKICR